MMTVILMMLKVAEVALWQARWNGNTEAFENWKLNTVIDQSCEETFKSEKMELKDN